MVVKETEVTQGYQEVVTTQVKGAIWVPVDTSCPCGACLSVFKDRFVLTTHKGSYSRPRGTWYV